MAGRTMAVAIALAGPLALFPLLVAKSAAAIDLHVVGGEEMVFAWNRQHCETWDVPDAPARAFRDADGNVRLHISHFVTRAMTGPSLSEVSHDCAVVFRGGEKDEPQAYDDRLWLASFWTADGRTVHGLAHAEYHGQHRPAICPAAKYMACWQNSVVQTVSTDGGRTFVRAGGSAAAVATLPYRYDADAGRPTGYFSPSNIISRDGYHYVFVFAAAYGEQRRGACLLRTERIDDPRSWRAWDGHDFTIAFADPYWPGVTDVASHVCSPIGPFPSAVSTVVRVADKGPYIAAFTAKLRPPGQATPTAGVYYAQSADLITWSAPRLLLAAPTLGMRDCADHAAYAYPSLLDENSPSRNFEEIGTTAYLYLTRLNPKDCKVTADRDLVRIPVSVTSGAADR